MPRKSKQAQLNERNQRRSEIMRAVSDSMKAISQKKTMDWLRETPETIAAGNQLDNAMVDYIEGKATKEDVKRAYKSYVDLHVVEKGLK